MTWLILKTDHAKEQYVARQVQNLGFDAWVPSQIIVSRPGIARRVSSKSHLRAIKELPILPRRVFVSVYYFLHASDRIRYAEGYESGPDGYVVKIPDEQIARFKAAIDAENTVSLALAQKANRKQKARWRDLKDGLIEMIQGAKETMEQAA